MTSASIRAGGSSGEHFFVIQAELNAVAANFAIELPAMTSKVAALEALVHHC